VDHNGATTFSADTPSTSVTAPEFDQARALVGRLPGAAAEVMLRRTEYVLKISNSQTCATGQICVDVYRLSGSSYLPIPEQQWKIATATGLPVTVRYRAATIGHGVPQLWKEVYFFKYAAQDGLVIPVSLGMNMGGNRASWTFVSLKKSPGFDVSKFDQEAAQ
jgi:hypothetical protein